MKERKTRKNQTRLEIMNERKKKENKVKRGEVETT